MRGLGVHASMWTMRWDLPGSEYAVSEAAAAGVDFIEIPLLTPEAVNADHTRTLLESSGLRAVCSLGLPATCWASRDPDAAIAFLAVALEKTKTIGAEALSGVTYGGIGERTGSPPSQEELDNVARAMESAARQAASMGLQFGIEPVNRYETHLLNTGAQAAELIERCGVENMFVHLDTYHMNIEEKGVANGILACRDSLKYIHLSESDRGIPGTGTCDWDEIFAALAAIRFEGGLAMESFVNLPPEIGSALSVWRPVASDHTAVIQQGLPFLHNKARQYHLL